MTAEQPPEDQVDTVGWDAIDQALEPIYGSQEPTHYGTIMRWSLGGPDPLDGISAYACDDPIPHWHFVSYGLTELYDKVSEDQEYSGWGFELTFRLAREASETDPPKWALSFLQNLARYVFESGNVLSVGDHMDLNGPIALESDTKITAAGFVTDQDLGAIDTPHGKVEFIQVIGLTANELIAKMSWDGNKFFELVGQKIPKYITQLDRDSLLDDPSTAAALQTGRDTDGSSTGVTFAEHVTIEKIDQSRIITLGSNAVEGIKLILPGRVPFGESYEVYGYKSRQTIRFLPGDAASCELLEEENPTLVVTLTADQARELSESLRPVECDVPVPGLPDTILRITPTPVVDDA